MGEVVVITSGKGGVGKSTCAAHLGAALARRGKNTVLIDADMGLRGLDLLLGLQDRIVYDLADVADGACRLKQAVVLARENLSLVAASQTRDSGALTAREMRDIASRLRQRFDYVLIDCPAGLGRGFRNAAYAADAAIVVATSDDIALRAARRACGLLESCDILDPKLVLNRAPMDESAARAAAVQIGAELLGIVPEDGCVPRAMGDVERLRHMPSGEAFSRIAERVLGGDAPIPATVRTKPFRRAAARFRDWLDG